MIFVITSLLFVPVVYISSSTYDACALSPDPNYDAESIKNTCSVDKKTLGQTCCWQEPGDKEKCIKRCQTCTLNIDAGKYDSCGAVGEYPAFEGPLTSDVPLQDSNTPTIQPDDGSTIPPPKGKGGLLGLLDDNLPTF